MIYISIIISSIAGEIDYPHRGRAAAGAASLLIATESSLPTVFPCPGPAHAPGEGSINMEVFFLPEQNLQDGIEFILKRKGS